MSGSKPHYLTSSLYFVRQALACWRTRASVAILLTGLFASPLQAAPEGTVDNISLDIGPGIFGTVRVLSANGEIYSVFADNDIALGFNLSIDMQFGEIKAWGLYWGECGGDDCFDEIGTPLLYSDNEQVDTFSVDETAEFQFPSSVLGMTPSVPVAGTNDFAAMVALCNAWLAEGGDITAGTALLYEAKATIGIDGAVDIDIPNTPLASAGQPYSYPPAFTLEDVDHAETFTFQMPVTCAAYHEPPTAGAPTGVNTELPDPDMDDVQLALDFSVPSDGAPHEYAGGCPVNVNLNMLVGTNVAAPIWVWVKHADDKGNNWTSAPAQFQTNQIANDGTWKWTRTEPLLVPVGASPPPQPPAVPLGGIGDLSGSGGGSSGGPSAVVTGFEGDPNRHVGLVQLFAGIGLQVVPLPDGNGGTKDVTTFQQVLNSGQKTYDVTCEPEVGPAVAGLPGDVTGGGTTVQPEDGGTARPAPAGNELTSDPATQASLDVPPIISLVLDDASVDPQHGHVNVPLGQDGFWTDGYAGTVTWRLLVGAVINPALEGIGTQWTAITTNVGPWAGGSAGLTPQLISLSDPPAHVVLSAPYVDQFMSSGTNTPQAICNARRQALLDQGQSLAGILGNHHIIDVTDQELPRAQLNASLAYDPDEDSYFASAVSVLPLRIRCLGNPEIAEQFLPSADAPGGIGSTEEFRLISAGLSISLDGQPPSEPATYQGSCSIDGTVDIKIAANLKGNAQYQVLHLSEANILTASQLTVAAVDQFNNGGYWEFDADQALNFPLDDAVLPGFSTEPGGFVTEDFAVPAAGDLVGNNQNDPNVHTGFFRVLASPVGVPDPTADSLWKKYRISCDPGEGGIGDVAAGGAEAPRPPPSGSDNLSSVPHQAEGEPPVLPIWLATVFNDETVLPDEGHINVPLGQDGFWSDNFAATVKWTMLIGQGLFPEGGVQYLQIDRKVRPLGGGESIDLGPQMLSIPEVPQEFKVEAPYASEFLSSGDNTPDNLCNAERQRLLDEGDSLADILGNHQIIDVPLEIRPQATLFMKAEYEDIQTNSAETLLKLKIRCLGNPEIAEQFLPSDDAPGGVGSGEDFNVTSAGLSISLAAQPAAEPATYEGSCPINGKVDVKLTSNLQGNAQYQVLHLSEANVLTASELTGVAVDDFNNGGYWEFDAFQVLSFPLADAILPGFSTEPGGFITEDFAVPAAADLIGNNNNDPNTHTGYFRVLASPVGVPVPTADSLWKKYRIDCDPGEGGIGDVAGGAAGPTDPSGTVNQCIGGTIVGGDCTCRDGSRPVELNAGTFKCQPGAPAQGADLSKLETVMTGPAECKAGDACPFQVQVRHGGDRPHQGPISLRVEPDLAGARLGSSNWQCADENRGISCQSNSTRLLPAQTESLEVSIIVPASAEPGTRFESCTVEAPPAREDSPARYVQFMLTRLGFEPGGIDGKPGPRTKRAVEAFQRANDIPVTGAIDDTLMQALSSLGGPEESTLAEPACASVIIAKADEPAAPEQVADPEPVQPSDPVIQPGRQVSVCRNGAIRNGQCVCRAGWNKRRISRFEYVCNRPVVRIVCDGGTVRAGKCVCRRGANLRKLSANRFRCIAPLPSRIVCTGGVVRAGQCYCPRAAKRRKLSQNRFRCTCPSGLRLVRGLCIRPR